MDTFDLSNLVDEICDLLEGQGAAEVVNWPVISRAVETELHAREELIG